MYMTLSRGVKRAYVVSFPVVLIMVFITGCTSTKTIWRPRINFAEKGVQKIAVVYVEGDYLNEAARAMEHELLKIPNLDVVTRSEIDTALIELDIEQSSHFNPSESKRLGELLGIDAIVVGSVEVEEKFYGEFMYSSDVWMTAQVIETETGRILSSVRSYAQSDSFSSPMAAKNQAISQAATRLFLKKVEVPIAE